MVQAFSRSNISSTTGPGRLIAGGGDTNTLIARRLTGRWRGIGAHAGSHVECRAHYAVVILSGGE
jgi:hypothetical protein